jgi:phage terminase large subunit-like protein
VTAWARAVKARRVRVGKLVRLACERHLRDLVDGAARGLHFDAEAANSAIDFFKLLKHSKGKWAGTPFELSAWQQFIVGCIFGWKRADGSRRFRVAYNEIPRKNGKSTLAAGLGILLAFFDNEPGAEVYCAATKRDQAKIVFNEAKRSVENTPALKRRISVLNANMNVRETSSKLEPLGADADSTDGLNPHGVIIDELHAHKTSALVDVLQSAAGARAQPLRFEITTAGSDRTSVCWMHHDYSVKVLEGVVDDDSWFAFIAAADKKDDWRDATTWQKANLNLGISVNPDYIEAECRRAQKIPGEQNTFRRLHLNQWTEQSSRAIDMALWDEAAGEVRPEQLACRASMAGLDMASTSDLAAKVDVFGPDEGGFYDVAARFWIPKASISAGTSRRSEEIRRQLELWTEQGFITATEGNVTDYDFVEKDILDDAERYRLRELAFDRWNVTQLITHLQDEWGTGDTARIKVVDVGQGFASMAAPTKEFLRLVADKKIRHGGNPVLRWMVSNLALKQDPAGNLKPDRESSGDKIDGVVALIMALGRVMVAPTEGESIYDQRHAAGEELVDSW